MITPDSIIMVYHRLLEDNMGILLSKKMKYFMVTMEKRSFGLAADDLCITRSPLSKVISEIEGWIGGKLFIRRHNDLEPTSLAWDFYHKCKPLYYKLLSLESECSSKKVDTALSFHFDISIPEVLFRQLTMIARAEKIDATFTREYIDMRGEEQLKYKNNHVIFSSRALIYNQQIEQNSWEGCPIILLSSKYADPNVRNNVFVFKDKYVDITREQYSYILSHSNIVPSFIEHEYDISTLLYAVRSGKGSLLMPQKMAQLHKSDDIYYHQIEGYYPRIYLYANIDKKKQAILTKFKEILSLFI